MSAETAHAPAFVKALYVEKLFGHYTYDLALEAEECEGGVSPVLLLYGDNGTGKTTLAQLVFHMLSRSDGLGHRTFLARTAFKEFRIDFQNGAMISAQRPDDALTGPFDLIARTWSGAEQHVRVGTDKDGDVTTGTVDDETLATVLSMCSEVPQVTYFLSDNRLLQSDEFGDEADDDLTMHGHQIITRRVGDSVQRRLVRSRSGALTVGPSIGRAEMWMRRQAITASSVGEENISTIFSDLIKRIASTETEESEADQLPRLRAALYELAEKSEGFVALGMVPRIPVDSLVDSFDRASDTRRAVLASVVEPYVDSIRARLSAMTDIKQRLSTFLEIINAFYRRKSVHLTLSDGITVFDQQGEVLDADLLSSGEKQLMLLLCNILVATVQPTLFIIDEPELSLNVKWQRRLVESLLELVEGSQVQFLMATHSIELLTRHKASVLRLEDRNSLEGQ